jgi:hypothetical protein
VHGLLSLQFGAGPPLQVPPPQASPEVQALPSLHGAVFGALMQPEFTSQESSVHALLSSQFSAVPPVQ